MNRNELKELLEAYEEATSGESVTYKITEEVELPEDATLWQFESEDGSIKASAISHGDDTTFVMDDWQEPSRPEIYEEIKNYDWRRLDGKPAIVFLGLPRCME